MKLYAHSQFTALVAHNGVGLVRLNWSLLWKWLSNRLASAGLSYRKPEFLNFNTSLHNVLITYKDVELRPGKRRRGRFSC
jgi:hypothetical protein